MVKKISLKSLDTGVRSAVQSVIAGEVGGTDIVDSINLLPDSVSDGTLSYVRSESKLYVRSNNTWIEAFPSTKNFFHIIQAGQFTGPIIGDATFTPSRSIQITSIEATVSQAVSGSLVFALVNNSTVIQNFTIASGETTLITDVTSNSINTTDVITMNIVSGSGQDLAVRFIYR